MKIESIGKKIWIIEGSELQIFGVRLTTRSTLTRLSDGRLWLHSPVPHSSELAEELKSLGPMGFLVAPNKHHGRSVEEWIKRYPDAEFAAPRKLSEKRPEPPFDIALDSDVAFPWAREIDQVMFAGSRGLDEFVFFHRPSRTAILTDLIVNLKLEGQSFLGRMLVKSEGVAYPHGRTPLLVRLGMRDRERGAAAARKILEWKPKSAVISHGEWFRENGEDELRQRLGWLPL